jgi:hypothetical protein
MSAAEKRVAIATDVIAALDAKHILAESMTYMNILTPNEDLMEENIADIADIEVGDFTRTRQCTVCALGALFTSAVERFDRLKCGDVRARASCFMEGISIRGSDIKRYLNEFFSQEQIELIEHAFEGKDPGGIVVSSASDRMRAMSFISIVTPSSAKAPEPESRMRIIMQNIIDNNGTFTL